MNVKQYVVELSVEERDQLWQVIEAPRMAAHKRRHAQMLLKLDQGPQGPGWPDAKVAEAFDCTAQSCQRLRRRLVERASRGCSNTPTKAPGGPASSMGWPKLT